MGDTHIHTSTYINMDLYIHININIIYNIFLYTHVWKKMLKNEKWFDKLQWKWLMKRNKGATEHSGSKNKN